MPDDEYTKELVEREREGGAEPPLTFAEFRFANRRRCEDAFHPIRSWDADSWMNATLGELGEAASVLKERRRRSEFRIDGKGNVVYDKSGRAMCGLPQPLTDDERQRLAHELADVVTYLDLLAEWADIDLGAAVREKFNIVSDRVGSKVKL